MKRITAFVLVLLLLPVIALADLEVHSLEDILLNHVQISFAVKEKLGNIQPYFDAYLQHGYYPFYKSERTGYEIRLQHLRLRLRRRGRRSR